MDRDKRWERVKTHYDAMVLGEAQFDPDPLHAVRESYAAGKTDEFIVPVVCDRDGLVKPGDTVFFINFRPDRARELTRAFAEPDFDGFEHEYFPVNFVCATEYDADIKNVTVAFPPEVVKNTLGEYVSSLGMTQMHIAETEKYAHVTFFLNGGREEPFAGEKRILIPSPREFPTYDLVPEMSARRLYGRGEQTSCCSMIETPFTVLKSVVVMSFIAAGGSNLRGSESGRYSFLKYS